MKSLMISIVVPVYNVEKELDRCVQSLLAQTYRDIEILLVDDGSTDASGEMCEQYAERDKRVRVFHKKNGGLSSARNMGIQKAHGEFLMYVDSDDFIAIDACENFMKVIKNTSANIDVVCGEAEEISGERKIVLGRTGFKDGEIYAASKFVKIAIKKGSFYAPVCFNMYRREYILDNNLMFKDDILHEDMEYLPRSFLAAKSVACMRKDFYKYIIRNGSISNSGLSDKKLSDVMGIYAGWKREFEQIEDKTLRRRLQGFLTKCFLATCRKYGISEKIYPNGVTGWYLVAHALNMKELTKVVFFVCFRKRYVGTGR